MKLNIITALIKSFIENIVRYGTVTATSPLAVQFTGETGSHKVSRLASYSSPSVDDRVLLIKSGNTYICLDKII